MDSALLLNERRASTQRFFERYLNREVGGREHVSVLFVDRDLPLWFTKGLHDCEGTRWEIVNAREIVSQREVVAALWDPERRYVSVHDYAAECFFPAAHSAVRFAEVSRGIDYTSFEFPRFGLTDDQVEELLLRYVRGDPLLHEQHADAFYSFLDDDASYRVEIRSGPSREYTLVVRGPEPWTDLAGPLVEGNIRFAPGAELFYHGKAVSGTLWCDAGINLLPLRHPQTDIALCSRLLALSQEIPADPLLIELSEGRVVRLSSRGPLADRFNDVLACDEAFSHVVEVGLGLSEACSPLVREWAATSNEAVPGVHVGIGADPANTSRFKTRVHLDFVCPDVEIVLRGRTWFNRGRFFNA